MSSVAVADLQEYFKKFTSSGTYDTGLRHVTIVDIPEDGRLIGEMTVTKDCCNTYGTLHGGFIATVIDVLTSFAMAIHHSKRENGVSVDLNVSYLRKAEMDETIVIDARTIKVGDLLGFAEAIITSRKTGDVIARGQHTRYIGTPNKYKPNASEENGTGDTNNK